MTTLKKAVVNYWVDLGTAVAFVLCAVTGIVFLLPTSMTTSFANGRLTILAISVPLLRAIHDWSGVATVAGVGVHLTLHARWIGKMTRRVLLADGGATAARASAAPRAAATVVAARRATSPAGAPAAATATSEARAEELAERRRARDRRYTRKGFLQGAAAAAGALVLGAGFYALAGGGRDGTSSGDGTGSGTSSSATTTVSSPVVIAASTCISCGRCLEACPHGVLAWGSDGRASAQNPGSCTRCGICVHVCPVGAITLTA